MEGKLVIMPSLSAIYISDKNLWLMFSKFDTQLELTEGSYFPILPKIFVF